MIISYLHKEAINLRKLGKSYSEISDSLKISKTTLSNWFAHKKWSEQIKSRLIKEQNKKNVLRLKFARAARSKKLKFLYSEIKREAHLEFEKLKKDPLFLAGLSLYWGEGEKANKNRVSIANTDPEMVRIMAFFYKKYLGISNKKLRVGLFIYEDIDEKSAIKFWSKKLNIPKTQFIKTQILKSRSKLTRKKSVFGICSLYFSNTAISIKIHEWIRLFSLEARE